MTNYPLPVKQLLDGELTLAERPPELRAAGEEALGLVASVDRTPVTLSPTLDARVMAAVRHRATSRARRVWRWFATPRDLELRLRVRPWAAWASGLAAAAGVALLLTRPPARVPAGAVAARVATPNVVFVRFVLYAPGRKRVAVPGTFNQWDQAAAPRVPAGTGGVWSTTLALPVGQHQYAFVAHGQLVVAEPAASTLYDGVGRRNSVVAVTAQGARPL